MILFVQLYRDGSKQDIEREKQYGEPYRGLKCSIQPLPVKISEPPKHADPPKILWIDEAITYLGLDSRP